MRFDDLSRSFPEDERGLMLAYEESRSMVECIAGEYAPNGILCVLNLLRKGAGVDRAFLDGLDVSFSSLENRRREQLRIKTTWYSYLSDHLYQLPFVISAVLLIYEFIKGLERKRTYKDEDEEGGDVVDA
ncbi:MAG: hypothetical protein AB1499_16855 [Nitrospirota bacterium]